jgi:hypothetical protein
MTYIKNVACYRNTQKEFFSQKAFSSLLRRRFLFRIPEDNFSQFILQRREQKFDENILNSQP